MAYFDADPRTMAGAMIGYAFKQFPDQAIACDDETLAFRLSAAMLVIKATTPFGGDD